MSDPREECQHGHPIWLRCEPCEMKVLRQIYPKLRVPVPERAIVTYLPPARRNY